MQVIVFNWHKSFSTGDKFIKVMKQYAYLGLLLSEHLYYNLMAKHVSWSDSRAIGLVISKFKAYGGLPYNTYTKFYDSNVYRTISYRVLLWGTGVFSFITAIQNRGARFFMVFGRCMPNAATTGEMG